MDLNALIGYISTLSRQNKTGEEVDNTSLDFLEYFAYKKAVSSYQICSDLKPTVLKMAYKNVNKRVKTLMSMGLLEQADINNEENKHKAKYYRLSEYGIYQLVLNRLNSLLFNMSDVRKSKEPTSNASIFFSNYGDCCLFEIFLYPFFKKDTLSAIKDFLLFGLYSYLSNCCKYIESYLRDYKTIPIVDKIFLWNEIPGNDDKLLSHLAQEFNLKSTELGGITKEDEVNGYPPTITVNTSSAPIIIKLDKEKKEVTMTSTAGNNGFQQFVYDVHYHGKEIVVSNKMSDDYVKDIIDKAESQIQQLVYELVYDLELSLKEQESSYYYDLLSKDQKFRRVVQKIYESRHKGFERGYKRIINKK